MKNFILVLSALVLALPQAASPQVKNIAWTFTAAYNSQHHDLDSIFIQNLTKGWNVTLYYPDTVLEILTVSIEEPGQAGTSFALGQNAPNPFSDHTLITVYLPIPGTVNIEIFTMLGQKVTSQVKKLDAGFHAFVFRGGDDHVYLANARFGGHSRCIKMARIGGITNGKPGLTYHGKLPGQVDLKNTGMNDATCPGNGGSGPEMIARDQINVDFHQPGSDYLLLTAFDFEPGDVLRFTGYVGSGFSALSDAMEVYPQGSGVYTFDLKRGKPCPNEPVVLHSGKYYHTVKIGNQCWLRENLRVGDLIFGFQSQSNNGVIEKWAYGDALWNDQYFGGLYTWDEMMNYTNTPGAQGICPDGWHLPANAEWTTLVNYLGGPSDAGEVMKYPNIWYFFFGIQNNNYSGFSALPGGWITATHQFELFGEQAAFWSSTESIGGKAYYKKLFHNSDGVGSGTTPKNFGLSVRCVREIGPAQVPAAPTGLTAVPADYTQINLHWTDNSNNEYGFSIERSPNGIANWMEIHTANANVTHYYNTGLNPGTMYYYRIRAFNYAGASAFSAVAQASTQILTVPATPTGLTATPVSSTQMKLDWTDNANNETHYYLERAPGGTSNFSTVATLLPNTITCLDVMLSPSTMYKYRVRAKNGAGFSAYSNVVTATTPAAPVTKLRIHNDSHYAIISIIINNNQHVTQVGTGLAIGNTYEVDFQGSGVVSYHIGIGFWDENFRDEWFTYDNSVNLASGQTFDLYVDNPTISQLLTHFNNSLNWNAYWWDDDMQPHIFRLTFYSNGDWDYYEDQFTTPIESGTVSLVLWPDEAYIVSFKLCNTCDVIYIWYPFSSFGGWLPNGESIEFESD